jgi:hypothetical protein
MSKRPAFTRAFMDLVVIGVVTVAVFVLSYFFNVFVFLVRIFERYPQAITLIDEILTVLVTLSIGFSVFSWRRWSELKKETAERIRLEKELIRAAETKAETEKIINKQLQCEIELRKKLERNASSGHSK